MKVGSVVVLYNFNESFLKNLELLKKYVDFIVLVDNSSVSSQNLFEEFIGDGLVYIPLYGNFGIATALNKGMEVCINQNCDWALNLDQDSTFYNDIIAVYRKYINNNTCTNIMGLCPQYFTYQNNPKLNESSIQVKETIQSGTLFNIEKYLKLGFFKDDYFIDYVDFEYCYRAEKQGYIFMRCNSAALIHNKDEAVFDKDYKYYREIKCFKYRHHYMYPSETRTYYVFRNGMDVFFTYKKISVLINLLTRIVKCILFEKNKMGQLKAMLNGFRDYKRKKYGINK
ncbi:glycosyltransferase [Clostridium tagluense]|uniref:Glycosyl transferase n=1 Tax=Clostridium tagluense TaxID=360422 RepID=A0A401UJI4_9CLOT|nr:glycosyltransferase [Clostridium tagluense]GCD09731.1 glycosyl transferase [Clostridium tagluense]